MSEEKATFQKSILLALNRIEALLEKLVNQGPAKPIKEVEVVETIEQDMTGLTYKTETPKAVLFLKNGFQLWVPKQFIVNKYQTDGNKQDIVLSDVKKANEWLPKNWEREKKL